MFFTEFRSWETAPMSSSGAKSRPQPQWKVLPEPSGSCAQTSVDWSSFVKKSGGEIFTAVMWGTYNVRQKTATWSYGRRCCRIRQIAQLSTHTLCFVADASCRHLLPATAFCESSANVGVSPQVKVPFKNKSQSWCMSTIVGGCHGFKIKTRLSLLQNLIFSNLKNYALCFNSPWRFKRNNENQTTIYSSIFPPSSTGVHVFPPWGYVISGLWWTPARVAFVARAEQDYGPAPVVGTSDFSLCFWSRRQWGAVIEVWLLKPRKVKEDDLQVVNVSL